MRLQTVHHRIGVIRKVGCRGLENTREIEIPVGAARYLLRV